MTTIQASDIIRLGALLIPVLVLFVAGQALRFDPNRRALRPSISAIAIKPFEEPWGRFFLLLRGVLTLLLMLDFVEIVLNGAHQQAILGYFPAWLIFRNPDLGAVYVGLALFAIWIIRRLKRMSLSIFDDAFETHLDYNGWRVVDLEKDSRPMLILGTWRYQMKWWFKTNLEPITAVQLRMICEAPTYVAFRDRVNQDEFPACFTNVMGKRPWGRLLGTVRQQMQKLVLEKVFQADELWKMWHNAQNPYTGQAITNKDQMADMLYTELRNTIICPACLAHPTQIADCAECLGSGTTQAPCPSCKGTGFGAPEKLCQHCGGTGLNLQPTPVAFLDRLQYLWMARNIGFLKQTFPVWLSNRMYVIVFALTTTIFLTTSLLFGGIFTVDLLVGALLFGGAALLGCVGGGIVVIFGSAFNSSGTLLTSYPVRYSRFGNRIWARLMNLIVLLIFGFLLIDTTFLMSQFLFEHHTNGTVVIGAAFALTTFVVLYSVIGISRIHVAMRDAKRSRLDELEAWLYHAPAGTDTSQAVEMFNAVRELQEWPLDVSTILGIISGVVLPILLTLGSILSGNFIAFFQK